MTRVLHLVVGSLVVTSALVGCQDATQVSVENLCSVAIEVDTHGTTVGASDLRWTEALPKETVQARTHEEDPRRLYVWVRAAGSNLIPDPVVFESANLEWPSGGTSLAVAVIEGQLCPSP